MSSARSAAAFATVVALIATTCPAVAADELPPAAAPPAITGDDPVAASAIAVEENAPASVHAFGWLSLLPPLVAIALAIATRRVLPALLLGTISGAAVLANGAPLATLTTTCESLLWPALADPSHLRVFVFTLSMGAMVGVMSKSGGMQALVDCLAVLARGRRGGQFTGWLLGMVIFFDDYANTVLLGNTLRPIFDRLRISREKLAYVVDSTSAPVAGLAVVSTWIAVELGFLSEGLLAAGLPDVSYQVFLASIPYRFYVLGALWLVAVIALTGRDFGPMRAAEQRAADANDDEVATRAELDEAIVPASHTPRRIVNAVLPVAVVVGMVLLLLYTTGKPGFLDAHPDEPVTFAKAIPHADSFLALVYAALAGLATSILLVLVQRLLSAAEVRRAATAGALHMAPGLAVLWLAWALSAVTSDDHLGTGVYVSDLLTGNVPAWLLPTLVFVLAAGISFATGTSWGTMALLVPLSVSVSADLLSANGPLSPDDPLFLATVGSVLAGAIFGDHCSPISDTTVLSSQASGCPHLAHVETQMPYAMFAAGIAIVCGTLPAGFGAPVWGLVAANAVAIALGVWWLGRVPVAISPAAAPPGRDAAGE